MNAFRLGGHMSNQLQVQPQLITKNDTYRLLIELGIKSGYVVIPEFRVDLSNFIATKSGKNMGKKNIDLVWLKRKCNAGQYQADVWENHWDIHAAIEIEAYDMAAASFQKHMQQFPCLTTALPCKQSKFIALYSAAFDRSALRKRNPSALINKHTKAAAASHITVFCIGNNGWQSLLPL